MSRLNSLGRRCLTWPALVALVALLSAGTAAAITVLRQEFDQRAVSQAIDGSRVISDLVVRRHVLAGDFTATAGLTDTELADMSGDIDMLQRTGRVVGLEVWRLDGAPLFLDAGHPERETRLPADERERAGSGSSWMALEGTGERGESAAVVFLPYRGGDGAIVGVIEVLLPEQPLTAQIDRAARWSEFGAVALLLVLCAGLLALRRRLRRQSYRARHDPLTALLNRAGLVEDSPAVLREATDEHPAALLVIDLNGFRSINNTFGHAAGDAVLAQVAATLRESLRPRDLMARLGGDSFAVLMPSLGGGTSSHGQVVEHLLERLRHAGLEVHGVAVSVEASVGVVLAPLHGSSAEKLLQRAEMAMYVAQGEETGYALYDPQTEEHDLAQLGLLAELRRAIEQDELVLHYQPQVALIDNAVVGVEALVRWQHPERGMLSPAVFIPLAENTQLIQPLTRWVLRTAIKQAANWRRAGAPMRVAVNISPCSLLHGDLPKLVRAMLADAGLPASLLELEITETAVIADPERAAHLLRQLAAMGVKVSIDDFGAGYTSLAHLKSLPVAALKIDRAFITNMLERPTDQAITEAIIELGHRFGLTVLAEGVETAATCDRLRELACDEVQGYLFARPLPPKALERWLTDWQHRHPTAIAGSSATLAA